MKKYNTKHIDDWSLDDRDFKPKRKNKNAKKIKRTKPRKSGSWE